MDTLNAMRTEGHEQVSFFSDPSSGLRCIIAIHDTRLGPSLGGTRMWPYASEADALTDVLRLSKAMTYKAAAAGLDLGGGKGLIIGDSRRDKTEALLLAYARAVDSLGGRYITAEDVGTTPADLEIVMRGTRHMVGKPPYAGGSGDSAPPTGLGVYESMRACAAEVYGSPSLEGRTVALQGFGKVASHLARHLVEGGARLVVADPNADALQAARDVGATIVGLDDIYDVECDVFSPCALGGVLNTETIPRLRCGIVAGSANNQLLTPEDAERVEAAGILYAPDFLISAGGIVGLSFELYGYDPVAAERSVKQIGARVADVIAAAKAEGITTAAAADRMAERRLEAAGAHRAA